MRHRKGFNQLSRKSAHRKAMFANMASSLILHKRIQTTTAKAKALRSYVEPLITKSKDDSTHSRRVVFSHLKDKNAVSELFREVSPKIGDRPGGYTRILKTGNRLGDNADMCIIELVDYNENMLAATAETQAKTTRRRRGGKKKSSEAAPVEATTEVLDAEVDQVETKPEETEAEVEEVKTDVEIEDVKGEAPGETPETTEEVVEAKEETTEVVEAKEETAAVVEEEKQQEDTEDKAEVKSVEEEKTEVKDETPEPVTEEKEKAKEEPEDAPKETDEVSSEEKPEAKAQDDEEKTEEKKEKKKGSEDA